MPKCPNCGAKTGRNIWDWMTEQPETVVALGALTTIAVTVVGAFRMSVKVV